MAKKRKAAADAPEQRAPKEPKEKGKSGAGRPKAIEIWKAHMLKVALAGLGDGNAPADAATTVAALLPRLRHWLLCLPLPCKSTISSTTTFFWVRCAEGASVVMCQDATLSVCS